MVAIDSIDRDVTELLPVILRFLLIYVDALLSILVTLMIAKFGQLLLTSDLIMPLKI